MCGLVGVISKKGVNNRQHVAFNTMLAVDTIRGKDSTGVGFIQRDNRGDLFKSVDPGVEFVNTNEYIKTREKFMPNSWALMGHNRAATIGSVNVSNAHPFIAGSVLLAHNGTLRAMNAVPKFNTFTVDSNFIAHSMNETATEADTLELLTGAYALSWFNAADASYNLARNSERTLHVARDKVGNYYYASTDDILKVGLLAGGIEAEITPLPVGEHWKFTRNNGELSIKKSRFVPKYIQPTTTKAWQGTNYGSGANGMGTYTKKYTPPHNPNAKPVQRSKAGRILFNIDAIVEYGVGIFRIEATEVMTGRQIRGFNVRKPQADALQASLDAKKQQVFSSSSVGDCMVGKKFKYHTVKGADIVTVKKYVSVSNDTVTRGPDGKDITIQEIHDMDAGNCSMCALPVTDSELAAGQFEWGANLNLICADCVSEWRSKND